MKNKIYTVLIIGIIALLWFAPIDLERERAMADTGPRQLILLIFETTWLKIAVTIFLGIVALGLQDKNNEES
jgi:hypothetical protein